MHSIADLLERFKGILNTESSKKETIIIIIKEQTGISIKNNEFEVKNGLLRLNTKPIYRNEVVIKKDKILPKFIQAFGEKYIREIV